MAKSELLRTRQLIEAAVTILDEENPMTIRQLFYRLVSVGQIQNNRGDYQKVSRAMTTARDDGRIDWEWIVDRSRSEYVPNVFEDAAEYAEVVRTSYRKDYWSTQPNYCEIWVEKDAIKGTIEKLTNYLGVESTRRKDTRAPPRPTKQRSASYQYKSQSLFSTWATMTHPAATSNRNSNPAYEFTKRLERARLFGFYSSTGQCASR